MTVNAFGIDLGTSSIKIYEKQSNEIVVRKNMIAIANRRELRAYGDDAYDMYEKTPGNLVVSYPLNDGVIADINNMELLFRHFIEDTGKGATAKPADYYIAVPTDITKVEKRAFSDLIRDSKVKAKKIMLVEKALADGLGLDIDVKNSQGVMVVDIGYDTTEISILSLGGIVLSRLMKMGGNKFDDAIRACVRKEFGLLIGAKSAEQVKFSLKELSAKNENVIVYGRDIVTGLPVERELPTDLIVGALQDSFLSITDNIRVILERTPPELSADIYRHGIYLTGGACDVSNFSAVLHEGTNLKVNVAEKPLESAAKGLSKVIGEEGYRSIAYSIEEGDA